MNYSLGVNATKWRGGWNEQISDSIEIIGVPYHYPPIFIIDCQELLQR